MDGQGGNSHNLCEQRQKIIGFNSQRGIEVVMISALSRFVIIKNGKKRPGVQRVKIKIDFNLLLTSGEGTSKQFVFVKKQLTFLDCSPICKYQSH